MNAPVTLPVPGHAGFEFAPDPLDVAVGMRLRLRRKAIGVSQSVLADRLGVSFQQVQKYERGANRISASTLIRAAEALETPAAWFLGEVAEGQAPAPVIDDQLMALLRTTNGQILLTAAAVLPDDRLRALARTAQALAPDAGA
ncbi:hypothetical protein BH11PSE1_BH11PSE1_10590 [soil metagenome]